MPEARRAGGPAAGGAPASHGVVVLASLVASLAASLVGAGCGGHRGAGGPDEGGPGAPPAVSTDDVALEVTIAEGKTTSVRAELTAPEGEGPYPVVLFLPGGGNVSRRGTRESDGARTYAASVDVTRGLAEAVARQGMMALAWDKRTCGPRDTPLCDRYPTSDLDDEGPVALVKDLEAACALARQDPRSDGRLVLWAHGQAAQIALASRCAEDAAAIVLVAPVPRRVDKVMVASLWARAKEAKAAADKSKDPEAQEIALDLKNRTASREAMFDAIEKGQFPPDARLLGATLAFWKAWIQLTEEVPGPEPKPRRPWIVVLGQQDTQYGPTDHERIRALGALEGAAFVEVEGADHHLLVDGALDEARLLPILDLVGQVLEHGSLPREAS